MKTIFSKIISITLTVLTILTIVSMSQQTKATAFNNSSIVDSETNEFAYCFGDDGQIEITGYLSDEDVVIIPDEIDGIPITVIGFSAFKGKSISKVVLSKNIREIMIEAFADCNKLETVSFKDGIEYLHRKSFANCTALKEINLPESCKTIATDTFKHCTNLKRIIINNEAPEATFSGLPENSDIVFMLKNLPDINLYGSLKYKGYFLNGKENGYYIFKTQNTQKEYTSGFYKYELDEENNAVVSGYTGPADIELLTIPSEIDSHKVVGIGAGAFDCKESTGTYDSESDFRLGRFTPKYFFSTIRLPQTLKYIGDYAFRGCTPLEKINIPDSVEYIGYSAFALCVSLTVPTLSASLKIICSEAFAYCQLNGELILPDEISYIGAYAFKKCGNITAVKFPDTLKFVGEEAFAYSKIESIKIPDTLYSWDGAMAFCDQIKNVEIENGITKTASKAFYGCSALQSVALPDSIKKIGSRSFYCCNELQSIVVSKNCNIEIIGESAFGSCRKLKNIDFAKNAELCSGSFSDTAVTSFAFTAKQKYIPDYIFCNCRNLSEVHFDNSVISIGKCAFENTQLKNVVMPDSIFSFGIGSFSECKELETVTISKNVGCIMNSAFEKCDKLYRITWEKVGSKQIMDNAFDGCLSLVDFSFEDIVRINEGAFDDTAITDVKLTLSNLEKQSVEQESFKSFRQLKTLEIGGNVQEIGSLAFAKCENLETAVIADSVIRIDNNAFDQCENLTIYCNENSYAESYAKANGIRVTTLIVDKISNQDYTGKEIKPQVNVRFSDTNLIYNKDYSTEYFNNINVGTASVVVSGLKDFSMLITKVDFAIVAVSIDKAEISSIPIQYADGQTLCEPKIKIKFNSKTLSEGKDYTVSYKNNKSEGTGTALIKGIGNFKNTASVDFTIEYRKNIVDVVKDIITTVRNMLSVVINWILTIFDYI